MAAASVSTLSATARMLALEAMWWHLAGAKEARIREVFDISATRYYTELNALIDREEALAAEPLLVKRLGRQRAAWARTRQSLRLSLLDL